MNDVKKAMLKVLGTLAEKQAVSKEGWPPACNGLIYQPKRPIQKEKTD